MSEPRTSVSASHDPATGRITFTQHPAAPPEDGRPTWDDLAGWIAEHGEHDTKCFQKSRGNRCVCGLESLLSRIPKEEP